MKIEIELDSDSHFQKDDAAEVLEQLQETQADYGLTEAVDAPVLCGLVDALKKALGK